MLLTIFPSKRSSKISFQTSPEVRHQFRRKLRQLHSVNRWCFEIRSKSGPNQVRGEGSEGSGPDGQVRLERLCSSSERLDRNETVLGHLLRATACYGIKKWGNPENGWGGCWEECCENSAPIPFQGSPPCSPEQKKIIKIRNVHQASSLFCSRPPGSRS